MKKILFYIIVLCFLLPFCSVAMDLTAVAPPEGLITNCSYKNLYEFIQLVFIILSLLILFIWLIIQHKKINKPTIDSIFTKYFLWTSPVLVFIFMLILIFSFSEYLRSSDNLFIKNLSYVPGNFGAIVVYFVIYLIIVYLSILIISFLLAVVKKEVVIKKMFWLLLIIFVLSFIYALAFLPDGPIKNYVDNLCEQYPSNFYMNPSL